ncbi:unnamed protein product [Rhodiola kirilowii]
MTLVLRFVDRDGYIQERFFGLLHVHYIIDFEKWYFLYALSL